MAGKGDEKCIQNMIFFLMWIRAHKCVLQALPIPFGIETEKINSFNQETNLCKKKHRKKTKIAQNKYNNRTIHIYTCVYLMWHDETDNENNDSFMIGWTQLQRPSGPNFINQVIYSPTVNYCMNYKIAANVLQQQQRQQIEAKTLDIFLQL